MRFHLLALVFATLISTVDATSKDLGHAARSRRGDEQAAITDHELSTSASLYSTLAHHHGYPYGWGIPINGLTHEVHPGMLEDVWVLNHVVTSLSDPPSASRSYQEART